MKLTIMTYNIQHGVDHLKRLQDPGLTDVELIDLDRFVQAIRPFHPDILSLNEVRGASTKPGFCDETRYLAEKLDMPYHFFAQALDETGHGPYGNALLSCLPFSSIEKIMIPDPAEKRPGGHYETRCLIHAVFDADGHSLHVLSTHFGLEPDEAQLAVSTALSHTDPHNASLIMGDFNLTPDSPVLAPLLTIYQDSATLLPEHTLTYPSHAPEIKIDYILGCGPLRFTEALVPKQIVSDHFPYITQIEV